MKYAGDGPKLRGLRVNKRLGDIISINNGELLIQVLAFKGSYVTLAIRGDREKYRIVMYPTEFGPGDFLPGREE